MSDDFKILGGEESFYKPSLEKLCEKALLSWGFDPQMDMVIEEMSELTKAILKYRRDPTEIRAKHIAEEIADVKIMLKQLDIAMFKKYGDLFNQWESEETFTKLFRLESMLDKFNE